MSRKRVLISLLAVSALAALIFGPLIAVAKVKEPAFAVVLKTGDIEVRRYEPLLAAEVQTTGARDEAIGAGFRILANYIFGGNKPNAKIAMTAPVTQTAGQKIEMTAPVTQTSSGSNWTVRFIMPAEYTLETLPEPTDPRIKIIAESAKTFAAIRFSGLASESNLSIHREKLLSWVKAQGFETTGEPVAAFYNPPMTLPFFRRNEYLIELVVDPSGAPRTMPQSKP